MNETSEKSNPSLAIVEKKPQRGGGGGCVGIFFQLFDWNRRFAKNKLFSKKLLNPPVRLKQASKKYDGDEKQPKLRLIADENSGGFPSSKNNNIEQKHEMRVPGLVARLMGLESMPSLHREKSKKFLASSSLSSKTEKLADTNIYVKEELMNVDKGCNNNNNNSKQESRPQKLQKTSVCENRPINRFGTEKLPFKDVLSKPKKHHPKLPSPVKSPRNLSRKSSSKLISAATRILEPGLQSKCAALTYSNNLTDERACSLPSRSDSCDCFAANEHSCGNCGYLLRNLDSKPSIVDEQQPLIFGSPFSRCVGPSSCQESERSKYEENPAVAFPFVGDNLQSRVEQTACNNGPFGGNVRRNSEQWKAPNYTRSQTSQRSKLTRNNGKFETEKLIVSSLKEESGPPLGRKRRPMKGESSGFTTSRQSGGYNGHFTKNRNESLHMQDNGEVDNGAASFKFNSSAKQRSGNAERKVRSNSYFDDGRRAKLENAPPPPLSGDALGAILEQKLKELNNVQGEDNIAGQKKTTATILQELIYALTSEIPFQHDNLPALPDRRNSWRDNTRFYSSASSTDLLGNAMTTKQYVDPPLESEHLSPGSVLEAYYSNESCVSSNLDDNLGYNGPHLPNPPNSDFSDFKNPILDILTNVSEILCCKNLASYGLKGDKFDHAKKVLTKAELAFHTSALSSSVVGRGSPIKHLLVDELETLASILWLNYGCTLGIEDGAEVNQLRRFGLDAVIEYLDQRFDFYSKLTRKLVGPLRMNTDTMMFEIVEAVRKWEEVSRFVLDELVEKELSCSLGEWTEFESEVFESGVEISGDVLQVLVDEIVVDLSKW